MGVSAYAEVAGWLYGDDPVVDPATRAELEALLVDRADDWQFQARPEQLPPDGDWTVWPYVAGRGAGKTRSGAEWTLDSAVEYDEAGVPMRAGLIARTAADTRDVMVEGDSGIIACAERRGMRAVYMPGKKQVHLPEVGAKLHTYSAMEPDSLRGPQHHRLWADEPAAWAHKVDAQGNTAWSNAMFGLRLDAPGLRPRAMATTTPKPIQIVREWFDAVEAGDTRVAMTRGALYDNLHNLAPAFVTEIVERYRDSPLALAEIYGALVLHVEGALWDPDRIERSRRPRAPRLVHRIVAVDPPAEQKAECGIIAMGRGQTVVEGDGRKARHVYVTDDYSLRGPSETWGRAAVDAYRETGASEMVVESNQGGDMVRAVVHGVDPDVTVVKVHASKSKWQRAEPVAAAWRRIHLVNNHPHLEAQMTTWTEADPVSPDRLDAFVHGCRHLLPDLLRPPARARSAAGQTMPRRAAGAAAQQRRSTSSRRR